MAAAVDARRAARRRARRRTRGSAASSSRDGEIVGRGATGPFPVGPHAEVAALARRRRPRPRRHRLHHARAVRPPRQHAAVHRGAHRRRRRPRRDRGRGPRRQGRRARARPAPRRGHRRRASASGAAAVEDYLAPYLHHRRTGRAFALLKTAMSLDGRTAAADGTLAVDHERRGPRRRAPAARRRRRPSSSARHRASPTAPRLTVRDVDRSVRAASRCGCCSTRRGRVPVDRAALRRRRSRRRSSSRPTRDAGRRPSTRGGPPAPTVEIVGAGRRRPRRRPRRGARRPRRAATACSRRWSRAAASCTARSSPRAAPTASSPTSRRWCSASGAARSSATPGPDTLADADALAACVDVTPVGADVRHHLRARSGRRPDVHRHRRGARARCASVTPVAGGARIVIAATDRARRRRASATRSR